MATEPLRAIEEELRGERDERGPAEPVDYAAINAVYAALFAGVVYATRRRSARDPIQTRELIPLSAATFALSKAVARERIGAWVREPFTDDETHRHPQGGRLRRAVGELVTCTRCVGTWSALAVVGLRVAHPEAGRTVSAVLATSAANDWLQTGFRWLCNRAD